MRFIRPIELSGSKVAKKAQEKGKAFVIGPSHRQTTPGENTRHLIYVNSKQQKGDISTLVRRGHFYFGLTMPFTKTPFKLLKSTILYSSDSFLMTLCLRERCRSASGRRFDVSRPMVRSSSLSSIVVPLSGPVIA